MRCRTCVNDQSWIFLADFPFLRKKVNSDRHTVCVSLLPTSEPVDSFQQIWCERYAIRHHSDIVVYVASNSW
jgi:hypothetical protein